MRRSIPLLLLFIRTCSYGQFVQGISVQSGVSDTKVDYHYEPQPSFGDPSGQLTGFAIRVAAELIDKEHVRLNTGIGFFQRGIRDINKLTFGGKPQTTELTGALGYLTFDVTAKGRYPLGWLVPYAFIGPRIDVLVATPSGSTYYERLGISRNLYGLRYGAGLGVKLARCEPFVEWCGLHTLNDLVKETDDVLLDINGIPTGRTIRITDRTVLITFGVQVRITADAAAK